MCCILCPILVWHDYIEGRYSKYGSEAFHQLGCQAGYPFSPGLVAQVQDKHLRIKCNWVVSSNKWCWPCGLSASSKEFGKTSAEGVLNFCFCLLLLLSREGPLTSEAFFRNPLRKLVFWRAVMALKKLVFRYIVVVVLIIFWCTRWCSCTMTIGNFWYFSSRYIHMYAIVCLPFCKWLYSCHIFILIVDGI